MIASQLGVPAMSLLTAGLALAVCNGLTAWLVMRLLMRPALRRAFR
jgi:hypothetical protein